MKAQLTFLSSILVLFLAFSGCTQEESSPDCLQLLGASFTVKSVMKDDEENMYRLEKGGQEYIIISQKEAKEGDEILIRDASYVEYCNML